MKLISVDRKSENPELPSLTLLKKKTEKYFLREDDSLDIFKKSLIPIGGFMSTFFGVNYHKGGISTIFKKGVLDDGTDSVWDGEMKLRINWKIPAFLAHNPPGSSITYYCDHCKLIYSIPTLISCSGKYNYAIYERDSNQPILYELFIYLYPDLDLDQKICTDELIWDFITGNIYWLNTPYGDEETINKKAFSRRNYYLKKSPSTIFNSLPFDSLPGGV